MVRVRLPPFAPFFFRFLYTQKSVYGVTTPHPFIFMNNLNWFRSAMVSTLPCHGRDCGFESRRNRHNYAELVELADTLDLESSAFSVQVQVLYSAP